MAHPEEKPWIETPLIESAALSKAAGCKVFLKLELLQPSGSFKSRGIGNLIRTALLDPENTSKELHFFSSSGGNAGLAAVIAARDLGSPCTVVVPTSTKPLMVQKLQDAGATAVIQHGESWYEADAYLREKFIDAQPENPGPEKMQMNIYVPPFDHPDIWTGAGTMISEIARQLPPLSGPASARASGVFPADVVICSVGGGGLFNGVVEGLDEYLQAHRASSTLQHRAEDRKVHVLAVETEGTNSLDHSLRTGTLQAIPAITSLATSLGARQVAPKTLMNAQSPPSGVDVVSVVGSDAEAARGVIRLADEMRLQVELACGISVDVATSERLRQSVPDLTEASRVVVVVCGGSHITAEMIAEYRRRLQEGWSL